MDMVDTLPTGPQSVLVRLLVATGIGLLIGLEREYAKRVVDKEEQFAGVRTYPFIALLGFLSAYLAERFGPWVFVACLTGMIAMVIATYLMTARAGSYGITTELSGIITFLLGALVFGDRVLFAILITVIVTTLLTLKVRLHTFITSLSPQDIRAFIQFTVISSLVLPFLPDEPFGPHGVWNLHEIWLMVILVTGISLAGYLLARLMGNGTGSILEGAIGGLVSSTAVTLSLSRRSIPATHAVKRLAATGIVAATAVMYPRILLETWVLDRELALHLLPSVLAILAAALIASYLLWRNAKNRPEAPAGIHLTNPLNFAVAIQFAAVYMLIQWLMVIATTHYPTQGLYASGMVFGATDMDAITLSIARRSELPGSMRSTAILIATASNTVMKFLLVVFFGDRSLRTWVGYGFGGILLTTLATIAWGLL